jgi:hypothetical protein
LQEDSKTINERCEEDRMSIRIGGFVGDIKSIGATVIIIIPFETVSDAKGGCNDLEGGEYAEKINV